MELKDFVRDSIVGVLAGLNEAAVVAREHGAIVNPNAYSTATGARTYRVQADGNERSAELQEMEFDVAVTVSEKEGDKATIGVVAGILGGGIASASDFAYQTTSRLRFKVPVGFPIGSAATESKPLPRRNLSMT
jgi:hypothetical protein